MSIPHPPDLTLYAVPVFVVLMVGEWVVLRRRNRLISGRDYAASLRVGLVSLVTINLAAGFVGWRLSLWMWDHRAVDLGTGWAGWSVALVAWDLLYYAEHRLSHEVRLFWASHVNHHSSLEYNLSTALRQPWTAFHLLIMGAPLALIGVRPDLIVMSAAINLLYQFWIHTEVVDRLGPLELVLNTPSHHRVHHGSNPKYLDRNYGGILIVWDRLFGTFQAEDEPVVYGLTKNIDSYHVLTIAFHEWAAMTRDVRRARTWGDRWRHALMGPGWTPITPEPTAPRLATVGSNDADRTEQSR